MDDNHCTGEKLDFGKPWRQIRLTNRQPASQSSPKVDSGKDSGKDSNGVSKRLAQNPQRKIPVVVGKRWQVDLGSYREWLADKFK